MARRSLGRVDEPTADRDVLLLVAPESAASYDDLVARLDQRSNARCVTVPGARAALSEAASIEPARIVAVALSFGAGAPWPADLIGLLGWATARWPDITFLQSDQIGSREHIVGWASQQAQVSLQRWSDGATSDDTAVLVVGEGNTPGANAEVCALARLLSEHRRYQVVEVSFIRDTDPTIARGIDRCYRLGARRIIVLPLSLLDGPFHQEVRNQTVAAHRNGIPETGTIAIAPPLLTPATAAAVVHHRYKDAVDRWLNRRDDGCVRPREHHHDSSDAAFETDEILPPRYRRSRAVSAASMRSAPLKYDAEGRVAWDQVWQSFCDLALAGGPPHRGALLEPPTRDEVLANPDDSARVVAEIARALSLITRLPVVTDTAPGWVGMVCRDEEMAVWLLRAIVVENISVRREGATLFLPAGPQYRIGKEIKNVITAVAKTHHYWTEHRGGR